MTRAVQTKNLNDVVSAVVRIENNNTATHALINQKNSGLTNFLARLVEPSTVTPGSSNSATGGSLISGIATDEARTLVALTEQFLGGGATAGAKSRSCSGYLKPECPGWYSNTQKKVVCPMANDPTCKARADASRTLLVKKIKAQAKNSKSKKTKMTSSGATLARDIAASLGVGEETPVPTTDVAATWLFRL